MKLNGKISAKRLLFHGLCIFLWLVVTVNASVAFAGHSHCKEIDNKRLDIIDNVAHYDQFAIWYQTDHNEPEKQQQQIQDIATQLRAADLFFQRELGLTSPLESERYGPEATQINVFLFPMESGRGVAYDEIVAERNQDRLWPCSIRMDINAALDPKKNVTPAHELFHLYQYSYNMFKTRWYLEGLTRVIEMAFMGDRPVARYLNKQGPADSCTEVFNESYSGARFWHTYFSKHHQSDLAIPKYLQMVRYSDGSPVFKVDHFFAGHFIKPVLENMRELSRESAQEMGYPTYRWPEKVQRSAEFDEAICALLENKSFDY